MKKIALLFVGLFMISGAAYAVYFFSTLAPEQEALKEVVEKMEQAAENPTTKTESPKHQDPSVTIPDEILEELQVTDLEVRTESIANTPGTWRAFLNADINLSDPSFVIGCLQYLDTGGRLILDIFHDEAGNAWVAEASSTELVGIGLLETADYERFQTYHSVNPEAACLDISRRSYLTYKLITTQVEVKKQFDSFTLMSGDITILLPKDIRDSFYEAKDAVLVGESMVFLGLDGVIAFDFFRWEASLVYEFLWKDLHGISNLIKNPDNREVVALAVESWDEELAFVIVYGYSQREGLFEYGKGSYAIAWELGVNGVANLAFPEDLVYLDENTLQITEYPEFNQKITDGDYPPDAGKKVIDIWEY